MAGSARPLAKDGAFGGNPAPQTEAYTVSVLCVVGTEGCVAFALRRKTERCITQVPQVWRSFPDVPLLPRQAQVQTP